MVLALTILAGLIVGSFLNVCIVRLPREESIVRPPSFCRACERPIRWYDNLPVVSYLVLGGRCRDCGAPISLRYPVVELLTVVLFVLVVLRGFPPREMCIYLGLVAALIVITFIDIDYLIIPDAITLPSILVAPALALAVKHVTLMESVIGILLGGGLLLAFAWTYEKLRKQEGMGLGDVKLMAMIGGLQGWVAVPFALLVGALVGSLVGAAVIAAKRGQLDSPIPFGPFLAFGSVLYLLAGPEIITWYFSLPTLF